MLQFRYYIQSNPLEPRNFSCYGISLLKQSGYNAFIDCCADTDMNEKEQQPGETTHQPTENRPVDREKASKLAHLLEGLEFPADKAKILLFVNQNYPNGQMEGSEDSDITQKLQNNLTDNTEYANVYQIEKQAGLVTEE
jgi:hypothetical protein